MYHVFQDSATCTQNSSIPTDDLVLEVSRQTSHYAMLLSVTNDIPAMFTICLLGAISDVLGRKIPVMVSGLTSIFRLAGFMIIAGLRLPIHFLLVGEFINGLGGYHVTCVIMMSSAHISDVASDERKLKDMLFADLVFFAGSLLSDLLTGFLLPYIDYFYLVSIMLIFQVIIVIYTVFLIPSFTSPPDNSNKQTILGTTKHTLSGTINVYFSKKDTMLTHARLWGILVVIILHQIVYLGIYNTLCVLVLSPPLCWRSILLGLFNAAHDVTFLIAGIAIYLNYLSFTQVKVKTCLSLQLIALRKKPLSTR